MRLRVDRENPDKTAVFLTVIPRARVQRRLRVVVTLLCLAVVEEVAAAVVRRLRASVILGECFAPVAGAEAVEARTGFLALRPAALMAQAFQRT